ncbi:acetyl-CoA carboxylase biotin carboxyl carrier protein [Streptococcus sp.]|uniref:acetyl-CoA carboxylase biotin carboxyl carrier protein n=1 Tax=Streptococcus sp. TaxID=1306 RepID=UPI003A925A86
MNISEIKDLLAQFDASTLREFSYKNNGEELNLSKNQTSSVTAAPVAPTVEVVAPAPQAPVAPVAPVAEPAAVETPARPVEEASAPAQAAEGEVLESPLVGVAYLSPSPEKPAFVSVGDTVKKGQTLLIVEAMKVMNEVPAPKDGVITEILVANEEVVDYGKGLVRIK